jgi:alkylation response protein AidB-like acyl-CoA dehydrogenase
MSAGLPPETEALREEVRSFVAGTVDPIAAAYDRSGTYPADPLAELGERGWTGLTLDEAHGGGGRSLLDLTVLIEELSAAMMPLASALALNLGVATVIERFGTKAHRERYLPEMARFETVGALGLSERGAGSDKSGIETVADRDGDEWVLDGHKRWVTNFPESDVVLTYARTGPSDEWPHNVSAFLVPTDAFEVDRVWDTFGARSVDTVAVSLSGARVACEAQVGEAGEAIPQRGRVHTGVNVPARAVGIARAALDDARDHVREREQFGGPLADRQGVRWRLAEMACRVDAARSLTRRSARLADAGEDVGRAAPVAKLRATEAAVANANDAMQLLGGIGYTDEADVGRYLRDARLLTIAGGPNAVHRDALAESVLDA